MTKATRPSHRTARRLSARALRAVAGAGLLAVFGAMTVGGAVYALTGAPTPPRAAAAPAPSAVRAAPAGQGSGAAGVPAGPDQTALKAADDARTMFTLLSSAVTSSTGGLSTALAGIPQVFDSVSTAREGAAEVADGLDETATASAALDQVSQSSQEWTGTIEQLRGMSAMTTSVRTNAVQLRRSLIANPTPDSARTVAQLDQVIAATDGLSAVGAADSLADSVQSLSQATASSSQSLRRARTAARSLRDGLATIERARPQAEAAAAKLSTGLRQLGIALRSIDAQLALIQTRLRAEVTQTAAQPTAIVAQADPGSRLAWSVSAAGAMGMLVSLIGLRRKARPLLAQEQPQQVQEQTEESTSAAPLADLARAISEVPTPGHGFPRPDTVHTDPWLPVQFARPA